MKTRRHYLKFTDEKKRFGDFEIDTMIGRNHKGAIMTTNDRCTHLVLIRRLAGKEAPPRWPARQSRRCYPIKTKSTR